jgi:hypothetical protein
MKSYKFDIMKKAAGSFFILAFSVLQLSAQTTNLERLNSYKIGFFTKKLNLTASEAEKFWPVYNEYQKQKNLIQQEKISLIRNFNQNGNTLSDSQMTEIGDKLVSSIVQESTLAVSFHKKLKEVLPPEKVIRFYQAENQYKVQLLNELQGRQQKRLQQGGDL